MPALRTLSQQHSPRYQGKIQGLPANKKRTLLNTTVQPNFQQAPPDKVYLLGLRISLPTTRVLA